MLCTHCHSSDFNLASITLESLKAVECTLPRISASRISRVFPLWLAAVCELVLIRGNLARLQWKVMQVLMPATAPVGDIYT